MLFWIKDKLRNNIIVFDLIRKLLTPCFYAEWFLSFVTAYLRGKGIGGNRYLWLKKYKNRYEGDRCFIVATGPSLTINDLELIKSEFSMTMNSGIYAFDKTEWRPEVYAIQDEYVFAKLKDDIDEAISEIHLAITFPNIKKAFKVKDKFMIAPLNKMDRKIKSRMDGNVYKFTDDCFIDIYDDGSVIFSLLQIACYFGFKEIYLLGTDCDYGQPKRHFVDYNHTDPYADIAMKRIMKAHAEFKKYADKRGIRVINCTRGGKLEIYDRQSLEKVLENG